MATEQSMPTAGPRPPAMTDGCAWIDGEFVPISEARISILDTGFVRSDATYDVVGVWDGRFFRLEDHLARFEQSCKRLRLVPPVGRVEMREILTGVVSRSGLREAYVSAIATRGVPAPGERDPRHFKPNFYAYAIPYVRIVQPEQLALGTHAVVARDTRRTPSGAVDPTVKNFQWGDFVRALFEAYDRDGWLPILSDGNGNVTEGPGFNVFSVVGGVLRTPGRGVLEGITRMTALEIAAELGIDTQVSDVPVSDLYRASEIFLTSTAGGIVPVASLDGAPVGSCCPGSVTLQIRDLYWQWHSDRRFATPIDYGG